MTKLFETAIEAFNNELNDYYQKNVADDRPFLGSGAMLDYLSELESAALDGTDLTWELGVRTKAGHIATFSPSEDWSNFYLSIENEGVQDERSHIA